MSERRDFTAGARLLVRGLTVSAVGHDECILDGIDLTVEPGMVLGVVGESGSGKTTLVRCLLGAVANGLAAVGSVELDDASERLSLLGAPPRRIRALRAERIAYLNQDPARSLTPSMSIGEAIAERIPARSGRSDEAVSALLRAVGLPETEEFRRRRPLAVSGGEAQRVALARALAADPDVLLLDEPTTGLDVLTQAELLDELAQIHRRSPRTTVIVSHDLAVVARLADELVVLRHGQIVERGGCRDTLRRPQHEYTRELVAASPDPLAGRGAPADSKCGNQVASEPSSGDGGLRVTGLTATHRRRRQPPVVAADGLDLVIEPGACVGLVGASGAGKSTIARAIVGAHVAERGDVVVDGRTMPPALDDRRVEDRWRLQLIPQDPASSLDPRRRVGLAVGDVVRRCGGAGERAQVEETVASLLTDVGLDPALAARRPGALSGGERQRVAIARALAASPSVLLCDEVTSALDASVQAGVVRLLRSLVEERGVAMLFITHDLGLVREVADRVAVLHDGRICEAGPVTTVLDGPVHALSRRLLAASLSLSEELDRLDPGPLAIHRTQSRRHA